jgi:hypothetical protein
VQELDALLDALALTAAGPHPLSTARARSAASTRPSVSTTTFASGVVERSRERRLRGGGDGLPAAA